VKRWMACALVGALCILAPICFGLCAFARTYALYHDSTEGRRTVVVVTNLNDDVATGLLKAYDADGRIVTRANVTLEGFASEAVVIEIDPEGEQAWGLVSVQTTGRFALAAWISLGDRWRSVENVIASLIPLEEIEYAGYWMTANYASTMNRSTLLLLVNPYDEPVCGEIYVHDEAGNRLSMRSFSLDARTSAALLPVESRFADGTTWGMLDIHCEAPILLVMEHLDAEGGLIDLDLVSSFYLVD